jgi:hypothetical protein
MPSGGQSVSLVHVLPPEPPVPLAPPVPDGHGGNDVTHWPFTQSAVAQLGLPLGHTLQTWGTAHWAAVVHCGPGEGLPPVPGGLRRNRLWSLVPIPLGSLVPDPPWSPHPTAEHNAITNPKLRVMVMASSVNHRADPRRPSPRQSASTRAPLVHEAARPSVGPSRVRLTGLPVLSEVLDAARGKRTVFPSIPPFLVKETPAFG